jgi:hypothetical protein
MPSPTAAALSDLFVTVITGVEGGTDEHWRAIIGDVHMLPIATNVRSNWAVAPRGTRREHRVIDKAAEIIRQAHPYIRA